MSTAQIASYALVGLALAISVVTDLRTRKINNVVTIPTLLIALALRLATEGWGGIDAGLASGLLGMLVGGLFFFVFAWLGGIGMGDVKLVAAVGAGVGFPIIVWCLAGIGLAGGVEALVVLIWKRRLFGTLVGMGRSLLRLARVVKPENGPRERIWVPYGVAIALGTIWGVAWWYLSAPPFPQ